MIMVYYEDFEGVLNMSGALTTILLVLSVLIIIAILCNQQKPIEQRLWRKLKWRFERSKARI